MSCVVGIDISTRAIDLVRLDENADEAAWLHVPLEGDSAWDRVRGIRAFMPAGSWWDDVYLVAVERPFVRAGQDVVRLAQGAVLACVPAGLEAWEVSVSQWKKGLGIPIREKPERERFPRGFWWGMDAWPQDARDALGVALYARNLNGELISKAMSA